VGFGENEQQTDKIEKGVQMAITLKALRVNKGLSQKEAAELLGITPETLGKWENGKTFPDVPNIQKIEKAYGVSYSDIIFCPKNSV
jgi:transcriptional regulator with XRE-family HTH domain